jgi:hypothetical protein
MPNLREVFARLFKGRFGIAALLTLVGGALIWMLKLRADTVVGQWLDRHFWTPLANGWAALSGTPTGSFVVAWLGLVLVLLALAVFDQAKTVTALRDWSTNRRPKPKPLPWEERQEIQEYRAAWNEHGHVAANTLHAWWDFTLRNIEKQKYYREYLLAPGSRFMEARERFDGFVGENSLATLAETQEAAQAFYAQYQRLLAEVLLVFANEYADGSRDGGFYRDFRNRGEAWREIHGQFRADLDRLGHRPVNKKVALKPGPALGEDLRRLLEGGPLPPDAS